MWALGHVLLKICFCSYWIWLTMTLYVYTPSVLCNLLRIFLLWKKFEVWDTLKRICICAKKRDTTILARGGSETSVHTYQSFSQLVCELCRKWCLLVCPGRGSIAGSVHPCICCQLWALEVVWSGNGDVSAEEEPKLVNSQKLLAFPNQQQGTPPRSSLSISAVLVYGRGCVWASRAGGGCSCTSRD